MGKDMHNAPKLRFNGITGDWEQHSWKDCVDISKNMVDPTSGEFDDLPHIGPGNIESFTGQLMDNIHTVAEDGLISGKFLFHSGDIIYGKINPHLGKYSLVDFEGLASADSYVLNAKNNLNQAFLYVVLQTKDFYRYSVSVSKRSGIPKINRDQLNEYQFKAPSASEQKKIGALIVKIDTLTTLHQRKLSKLQDLKKALLVKMFPAEGETLPAVRFKGFTGDWKQRKLGDVADIIGGGTPDTKNPVYWGDDINWYAPAEIGDQVFVYSSQRKITKEGYANCSAKMLPAGTVLFTSRAGIGKTAILATEACTNQGFQSIVPYNEELDSYFIFSRTKELKEYGETVGAGSTFAEVSGKQMAEMELMMPKSKDEQKRIGSVFKSIDVLITLHQRKLSKLKDIKKALLNNIFPGGDI